MRQSTSADSSLPGPNDSAKSYDGPAPTSCAVPFSHTTLELSSTVLRATAQPTHARAPGTGQQPQPRRNIKTGSPRHRTVGDRGDGPAAKVLGHQCDGRCGLESGLAVGGGVVVCPVGSVRAQRGGIVAAALRPEGQAQNCRTIRPLAGTDDGPVADSAAVEQVQRPIAGSRAGVPEGGS